MNEPMALPGTDPVTMSECLMSCLTPCNAGFYAGIVKNEAFNRFLRVESEKLAKGDMDPGQRLAELRMLARRATDMQEEGAGALWQTWTRDYMMGLNDKGEDARVVPMGLESTRGHVPGLAKGVVSVVGARTSIGKSALAAQIARHLAMSGRGVHYFSLEDTAASFVKRALASLTGRRMNDIRQIDRGLMEAGGKSSGKPLWIDQSSGLSGDEVAARVRRQRGKLKTELVVVDYLQLLRDRSLPVSDRKAQVESGLSSLVDLARTEDVAVLAVSQLNRECEKENRPPKLTDLRESGEIEQAVDLVMLLHRDRKTNESSLGIAKNKNGTCGVVALEWDGPRLTYRDKREENGWYGQ